MGLIVLAIFFGLSGNKFIDQMGLAGACFYMLVNTSFVGVIGTVLIF